EARTANDAGTEWRTQLGVEDDSTRRDARRGRVANGEHRIVGEHGTDADGDRVDTGAHVVHLTPGFGACEPVPSRAPGSLGIRDRAVERHRELEDDPRP